MAVSVVRSRWRFVCQGCSTCSGWAVPDTVDGYSDERSYRRSRRDDAGCDGCGGMFMWEPCTVVHLAEFDLENGNDGLVYPNADWARGFSYP